jgi:hypothetical protein
MILPLLQSGGTRHMKKIAFSLLGGMALAALASGLAHANVYIGLREAGVNGGALTQVASGADFASWSGAYGSPFDIQSISITNLTDELASTALDILGTRPATLNVFVTSTDQMGNSPWLSAFAVNSLSLGWTITESTFIDFANGIFTTAVPLASEVFNAIGTATSVDSADGPKPHSVTAVYTINDPRGFGSTLGTIRVSAAPVPEPSSILLLLGSIGWLSFIGMRGRKNTTNAA